MDKEVPKNVYYSFNRLYLLFTSHPESQNMTYLVHFKRALSFSLKMSLGSLYLFIHALFPFLFERAGSDIIEELTIELKKNKEE